MCLCAEKVCNLLLGKAEWKCKFYEQKKFRHAESVRRRSIQREVADFSKILAHIVTNLARNNIMLYCRLRFASTWADISYMNFEKMVGIMLRILFLLFMSWFWAFNVESGVVVYGLDQLHHGLESKTPRLSSKVRSKELTTIMGQLISWFWPFRVQSGFAVVSGPDRPRSKKPLGCHLKIPIFKMHICRGLTKPQFPFVSVGAAVDTTVQSGASPPGQNAKWHPSFSF